MAAPGVGRAFDGPAAHFQVAAAVKIFISRQNSFFQARGHSEDLLGRSGLVRVADAEVSPGLVPCHLLAIGENLVPGVVIKHLVFGNFLAFMLPSISRSGLRASQRHEFFLGVAAHIPGIVQVKGIAGGHGQNLPVVGVHGDRRGHLASHGGLPFINIFLHNVLNIHINGGDNGLAVFRRFYNLLQIGLVVQITVFPAVYPYEAFIIILFNAARSHGAVPGGKADHVAGQAVIRINALVFIFKPNAFHPLFGLRQAVAGPVGLV